jgi:hypothetical protein
MARWDLSFWGIPLSDSYISLVERPSLLFPGHYVIASGLFPLDNRDRSVVYYADTQGATRVKNIPLWLSRDNHQTALVNYCLEAFRLMHWSKGDLRSGIVLDGTLSLDTMLVLSNPALDSLASLPTTISEGSDLVSFWAIEFGAARQYECRYSVDGDILHPTSSIDGVGVIPVD